MRTGMSSMWLYPVTDSIDLKINKALIRAKRSIVEGNKIKDSMTGKVDMNAAGQMAIRADIISEKIFLDTIADEGLSGVLYSEESGVTEFGDPNASDENKLIIMLDPLDGSKNYGKGWPIGCISVAYGPYKKVPTLADLERSTILNLYDNEIYFGVKGVGAWLNGTPLEHSSVIIDENDVQMSYYAYGSKGKIYPVVSNNNYEFRSLGSAAWELALVAGGFNDAYADLRGVLKTHDFAAAKILIESIGGRFDFVDMEDNGKKIDQKIPLDDFTTGYRVVASLNEGFADKLEQEFNEYGLIKSVDHLFMDS